MSDSASTGTHPSRWRLFWSCVPVALGLTVVKLALEPLLGFKGVIEFNSDLIAPEAMSTVTALGQALSDPALKDARILLAGHTDARGSASYNKSLSERRARAVSIFLVQNFSLSSERLKTIGFGKQRLKNPAEPFADENRRVQIVNLDATD